MHLPGILILLALAAFPLVAPSLGLDFYISMVRRVFIFAMVATSLNFILGYGGMVALGHAAFFGVGAYAVAILASEGVTQGWVAWLAAGRRADHPLERAVEARSVLTIDYRDEQARPSKRDVRPLGLWFWGKVWTVVGWCELRADFRAFRIDRIASITCDGRVFKHERGKQLADFYRQMERDEAARDWAHRRSQNAP